MRTRITLALAAGLLAAAVPANALPPQPIVDVLTTLPSAAAYCDLASLTGHVDYTPAIQYGPAFQPVSWVMDLNFSCTGTGIYNGTYTMQVAGSGSENCAGGLGSGTVVSGAKTSGPGAGPIVGGTMRFSRAGLHYYISHPANGLDFTVQETVGGAFQTYKANLWLDLESWLRPNVTADVAAEPVVIDDGGNVRLPRADASVSFAPAPCVDSHDLVGHGFLGEKNRTLQQIDDAVAQVVGGAIG